LDLALNRDKPSVASPQGLCLISHFARIFIAFTLAAASCSISKHAQKEEAERKEAARQVTSAYYSCVRTSFASQLPTMVDRNMAIRLFWSAKPKNQNFKHSKILFQRTRTSAMRPCPPTAMR
jgi:hypothetical protein